MFKRDAIEDKQQRLAPTLLEVAAQAVQHAEAEHAASLAALLALETGEAGRRLQEQPPPQDGVIRVVDLSEYHTALADARADEERKREAVTSAKVALSNLQRRYPTPTLTLAEAQDAAQRLADLKLAAQLQRLGVAMAHPPAGLEAPDA